LSCLKNKRRPFSHFLYKHIRAYCISFAVNIRTILTQVGTSGSCYHDQCSSTVPKTYSYAPHDGRTTEAFILVILVYGSIMMLNVRYVRDGLTRLHKTHSLTHSLHSQHTASSKIGKLPSSQIWIAACSMAAISNTQ
jgi:hypothetical protein